VPGFRTSFEEAKQAARIGALIGDSRSWVTSYARVELISLLASDLPRARAFVASQLGPLAVTGGTAERLRETVLAFLASGGRPTRVAEELFVHKNTVSERIKRAEKMLGRGVDESPQELEAALTLAVTLGDAVLGDADSG
jgi:DNA-binding PucR family transcriptional regulator